MESIEQLHKHLDSLDELRTIVRTMKALSAANIRQYERAVKALSVYYRTVERGLHVVVKDMEPSALSPAIKHNHPFGLAAIVFGSDHGLCGRFNEEISEHAVARMDSITPEPQNRRLLAVGARVAASLEQVGQNINECFLLPGAANQITATIQQILLKIDQWQTEAHVHSIYLFYNRRSGGQSHRPTGVQLMPVDLKRFHSMEETWPSRSLPIFSMNREQLLSDLLHQYLFVSIFRACAESQASEHISRLTTMQSAERNLDERLEEVTMKFRRARQNTITSELLDVVSGFEAIIHGKD